MVREVNIFIYFTFIFNISLILVHIFFEFWCFWKKFLKWFFYFWLLKCLEYFCSVYIYQTKIYFLSSWLFYSIILFLMDFRILEVIQGLCLSLLCFLENVIYGALLSMISISLFWKKLNISRTSLYRWKLKLSSSLIS